MIDQVAQRIAALLFDLKRSSAMERARVERESVLAFLESDKAPPVYGFTTMLGNLDHRAAGLLEQQRLLKSHLVGPASTYPAEWGEILSRVKLAQLSHGGSGVRESTLACLYEVVDAAAPSYLDGGAWAGNWTGSYGSGDVVPGAWFAKLLSEKTTWRLEEPGDLISLINGNFVSTAAATLVAISFLSTTNEALKVVEEFSPRDIGHVQLPVTLRDLNPIRRSLAASQLSLLTALADRLSSVSANPVFTFGSESDVEVRSQSSFLDFELTAALSHAMQAVAQLGVYLKAVVRRLCDEVVDESLRYLQPPKVIEAYLRQIASIQPSTSFGLAESNGVEDVCDLSLQTACSLARSLELLTAVLDVHGEVAGTRQSGRAQVPEALQRLVPAAHSIAPLLARG